MEHLLRIQTMDELEKRFCEKYSIRVLNEKRGYRTSYNRYFSDPQNADIIRDYYPTWQEYMEVDGEMKYRVPNYEKVLVVEIPQRSLDRLLEIERQFYAHLSSGAERLAETIIEKNYEAAQLRKKNPAVQAAWEQYSLVLHLAANGKDLA